MTSRIRGGRGDRKMGGSDWLIGKNHDTFGPLGPYIVPKEFIKDPMHTRHTMYLNNVVMQDSNTDRMSHNIYELLSFASNIMTLNAGDVISGGSPRDQHRARRSALDARRRLWRNATLKASAR
jgi:2-keto-4-pentenoate hydratase/2-oxohepta-3-ene-1,7-dioic acid hydratase in catechol pathway